MTTGSDYWNRRAAAWTVRTDATNDRPDPYGTVALDALPLDDGNRVIDIGCGPADTTIELARRVGPDGHATGIDVAPLMIAEARHRVDAAIAEGEITPHSIDLRTADAQTDPLGTDLDAAFSRFGVMFFAHPGDAFANIASALHPGGRLSIVVWAELDRNPWATVPTLAAADSLGITLEPPPADGPGPFSLGDADRTMALLTGAGFATPDVIDITQGRLLPHATAQHELALWLEVGPLGEALSTVSSSTRDRAVDAALAALANYRQPGPVGDWVVPAHARVFFAQRR